MDRPHRRIIQVTEFDVLAWAYAMAGITTGATAGEYMSGTNPLDVIAP